MFAVSVGRKKPSRKIMQKMLKPIVSGLQKLEQPQLYRISDYSYQMLRVYLIGVSNDKPANTLVQNQPEPNALYGCSKCEIPGKTYLIVCNTMRLPILHRFDFRKNSFCKTLCNTESVYENLNDLRSDISHFERSTTRNSIKRSVVRYRSR